MRWITKDKKINLIVMVGISLIALALTFWLFTIMTIRDQEIMLASQNLGVSTSLHEEALQRLKNAYVTTIIPASGILTMSGILIMLSPKIIGFVQSVSLRTHSLAIVEDKAVSFNDNVKKEPRLVLQNLVSEEANLNEEKKKLESLREKWQLKVEKDIESKKKSIKKLRAQINDLKFICEELSKSHNSDT